MSQTGQLRFTPVLTPCLSQWQRRPKLS